MVRKTIRDSEWRRFLTATLKLPMESWLATSWKGPRRAEDVLVSTQLHESGGGSGENLHYFLLDKILARPLSSSILRRIFLRVSSWIQEMQWIGKETMSFCLQKLRLNRPDNISTHLPKHLLGWVTWGHLLGKGCGVLIGSFASKQVHMICGFLL